MKRKFIKHIRIYMFLAILSCITNFVFSKELKDIKRDLNEEQYQAISDSVRFDDFSAIKASSCVSVYENQTVSTSVSVLGCTTLTVQKVTVTNNGNLTLSAPDKILINGVFEIQQGGSLLVGNPKNVVVQFIYDAAGNRISRQISQ